MDSPASSSVGATCRACRRLTLARLRDAFRVQTAGDIPDGMVISYPHILTSARSCGVCALILAEMGFRAGVPDFFSSTITTRWRSESSPRVHSSFGPPDLKLVDAIMYMVQGERGSERRFNACTLKLSADEGKIGFLGATDGAQCGKRLTHSKTRTPLN